MNFDSLMDSLVADLQPVKPISSPLVRMIIWTGLTYSWVFVWIALSGGVRSTFAENISAWRFLLEISLFFLFPPLAVLSTFQLGIPSPQAIRKTPIRLPLMVFAAVAILVLWNLIVPSLPPSMVGKRSHCYLEAIILSTCPFILASYLNRRSTSPYPMASSALLGLGTAIPGTLAMNVACMYEPWHVLAFHILPVSAIWILAISTTKWLVASIAPDTPNL